MALDPVCGMQVNETDAAAQSEFGGQTYFFCSTDCKEKFEANPQQFTAEKGQGRGTS